MLPFVLGLLLAAAPSSVLEAKDEWLGLWVFPRDEGIPLHDDDDKVVMEWSVSAGKVTWVGKEWIFIRHNQSDGPYEGYVRKSDVVKLTDATGYFTGLIEKNEREPWAWGRRAEAWSLKGEYNKAIEDCTEVINLDPRSYAYIARGAAWHWNNEFDKAIQDFDEAIRLDPNIPSAFNYRAMSRYSKKEYDKAIKDYNVAIRLDPKLALAFYGRGLTWYEKGEYDKAIKDYNVAIRLDPKDALTFLNRGNAWFVKKEYDKAIKDYTKASRLDPQDATAFLNRGNTWHEKKEYDKAIGDYTKAVRLDPKYAEAFSNRGDTWREKKEYNKAIKDYDEAIRLDPKSARAYNGRGDVWTDKKDYDKAIKDYEIAIRLDPQSSSAHFNRSVALLLARRPGAFAGFKSVLYIEGWKGENTPYAIILGHLAARQEGDEAAAKHFLDDSAGNLAEDWPYPVIRYLRGEIDEKTLLKLATDGDKQTEAHCYLGMDHILKGHKDEALAHFRWVKEHGVADFTEYTIAVAELERLERGNK